MDRMRQAVFSSLGASVEGASFVDLFAGSGSYGLEALSRGASSGVFVEQDRRTIVCLKANLEAVCKSAARATGGFKIVGADAFAWRAFEPNLATVVFADPPYRLIEEGAERLFAGFDRMLSHDLGARVVFEMPAELNLVHTGWSLLKRLGGSGAGAAVACIYTRAAA